MRRLLILSFCLVLSVPAWAQEQAEPVQHGPKIVCDEPTFNFGEINNTENVQHSFILRNEGDLSLEISRVRAACGCTVTRLADKIVPPGGQTKVNATFRLRGRTGHQKKSITVESNDPQNPRMMLYLEGQALAEMQSVPNRIHYGQISAEKPETRKLELKSHTGPFTITKIESNSEQVGVEIVPIEGSDNKHYKIMVTTKPPLATGTLRANLRITTDKPNFPDINVPVSANVVGALTVAPREIVLANIGDKASTRYVIVRPGQVKEFQVLGVITPDPTMQAIISQMGSNGYRIQLNNITPSEELNGKVLLIKTDVQGMHEISVPFKVLAGK